MPQRKLSPRQVEKRERIIEAALKVFSEEGYSAASMDAIAIAAEVSKPTLYMYFGSKEQLFESMLMAQRAFLLESFEHPSGEMVRDLHNFAWAYATVVMQPEFLALARLVIGEAQRFPEIGRAYQAAGPDRLLQGIIDYLESQRRLGKLSFEDGELAAQDLWALILSAPRNKALHTPDDVPGREDIRRYLENGLRVFLRAYSTEVQADLTRLARIIRNKGANGWERH
jgi:TetR/AcrR family transcriptional regulator, mexJK operon transcriptional repressor